MSRCIKIGAVCACGILCGIAAFGGAAVASLPPPKMDWRFGSDAKSLNAGNFGNALDIETVREGDGFALRVSNRRSPKYPWKTPDGRTVMREVDTAWRIESKTFDVKPGAEFAVRVRASCVDSVPMAVASPPPAVMWYGADGKPLITRDAEGKDVPFVSPVPFAVEDGRWKTTVGKGVVPDGARSAALRLSCDQPNMMAGQSVTIASVAYYERLDGFGWDFGDLDPPEAERITPSPCADFGAPVSIRLSDPSGIDRTSFRCALDGTDITEKVSWKEDVFTYTPPVPWERDSLHEFAVACSDTKGNAGALSCFICFTAVPLEHEKVAVRDDGMLLVGGRPFFQISISSVSACPLNGGDIDHAVLELREAGFNAISTYMVGRAAKPQSAFDALISACDRHGMKIILEPALRTGAGREERMRRNLLGGRRHPCTLGWCIGDDTAMHRSPDDLRRDNLICKAIDPDAVTEQADIAHYAGRYGPYAPYTDLFKVELYPIVEPEPQPNELPMIPRDLKFVFGDLAQLRLGKRCVVPILQFFSGWTRWKRFPTYEEVRAETFLAIANRARGASFYTYWSPNGQGAASTRERFDTLARVTREVAGLADALSSRDAARQPEIEIVSGPKVDAFGQPSISCLQKETGLVVAANSAAGQVAARFTMADGKTFTHVFERNGVLVR